MNSRPRAAMLAAFLALATGSVSARLPSLEQAFRTCAELPAHPLAGELMRSVWKIAERSSFAARHATQVRRYRVVDPGADEPALRTAIVDLTRPLPVAGVSPLAMSATACEFGCSQRMWSLEFGVLSAAQIDRLAAWAANGPAAAEGAGRVELEVDPDGSTALVCDIDR